MAGPLRVIISFFLDMRQVFFFLIFLFLTHISNANLIQGVVIDKISNKPISYVSIGIVNTPYGTYSSENGQFKMNLIEFNDTDSLRFSCVGYNSISYSVSEFIDKNKNGLDTIYLNEKITALEEIIIYNTNYESKIIGNRHSIKQLIIGFFGDREKGIIIENKQNLFLKAVSFKLTMSGGQVPDSAIFRFNIYNLKNGLPYENILNEPIYFHLNSDQFYGKNKFDISKYNIRIEKDFAATFELIRQFGGSRIYFAAWNKGCPSIYRKGSQGAWIDTKTDKGGMKLYQSLEIETLVEEKKK